MNGKIVSADDFRGVLTDQNIMVLRIIHFAIASGILMFFGVVFYLYNVTKPPLDPDIEGMQHIMVLTRISMGLTVVLFFMAHFIFNTFLKTIRRPEGPDHYLAVIRSAMIIRIAVMEAAAFFGLVVCFMAVKAGVIQQDTLYWINALPALLALGFILYTLPDRNKLETLFSEKFGGR